MIHYNNALEAWRRRQEKKAEAELLKAEALKTISEQPADKINPLVYIIPVAAIIVLGIVVIVIKRKK